MWADYNEAGEAVARYLFGDGIDSNIARWQAGAGTAWYLTDHLGTIRTIAEAAGMLVNQTTYDSYGQILAETNSQLGDRFKFTGRESIRTPGQFYSRARVYDASIGSFISLDPVLFSANDTNLYRYVGNFTSGATDPTGLVETPTYSAFLSKQITLSRFLELTVVSALGLGAYVRCQSNAGLPGDQPLGKCVGVGIGAVWFYVVARLGIWYLT